MKFKSLSLIISQSKRKFSAVAVILALSLTWAACQKSNSGAVAPAKIDQKQYDKIGLLHNRTVDSVYNILLTMKTNHKLSSSKPELTMFVKTSILNGLTSNGEKGQVINAINSSMNVDFKVISNNHSKKINSTTLKPTALYSDSLAAHLSVNQKLVFDKLLSVMTDESTSFEETKNQINALEASAKLDLSENELPLILVSTSIAKNTVEYWHDNIDKWNALLNDSKLSTQSLKNNVDQAGGPGFSWKSVGATDVATGAGAAVTTWWLNVAGGPMSGQIAYGTAIASAAAGGSVANAIYQLINN
ncbi:hypothetical protein ACVW0P_000674 [Mucilaginibacter sp. UYNi724]